MTRIRTLRKDRDYPMLNAAIGSLKYKELLNYMMVFGKLQILHRLFMPKENFDSFMRVLKTKINEFEVERKINYKEFRDWMGDAIEVLSDESTHNQLIQLARDIYNLKNEEDAYIIGKRIFGIKD